MRLEKTYDNDISYEYKCDKCDEITEVWAGKNTFFKNKSCPKCERGFLELVKDTNDYNKSANICMTYGKEKNIQWLLDRTEKQKSMGKKLGY